MDTRVETIDAADIGVLLTALQALKKGDFSARMPSDWTGLAGKVADTLNDIIDANAQLAAEVVEVSRAVGREGRLARRAVAPCMTGGWDGLLRAFNGLIDDLVRPTVEMARVIDAVARGDLSQTMAPAMDGEPLRGQFLCAATAANAMVDQLAAFTAEVTRVAREVGTEGKLGGQAAVPGAMGTWKDLTSNVNLMATTLTTQVREISEVATAVTRGDFSRSIQVEARGEISFLKDNINEMIRNLKETTHKNAQQDWLKSNLARFTRLLQGQRNLETVCSMILSELAPLVHAHHGVIYRMDGMEDDPCLAVVATYGYEAPDELRRTFRPGQGLIGQCALEKQRILLTEVPGDYVRIVSGLGTATPANLVVLPVLFEQQVMAVIEIASLKRFTDTHLSFLDQLMDSIGVVLNTIDANSRTESLLIQSQSLAQELQHTNLALAEKARLLSQQNMEVESKNREVEQAKRALEEKAAQLALSSKYKSEFLANMSHELRTPLNSLLILAQQLSENHPGNLSESQVEFARTIHGSGSDLLTLINDILDLSKIESGTVTLALSEYRFETLRAYVERTFRHMAAAKAVDFDVRLRPGLPASLRTDTTRLQQILRNLLSNAFKFTPRGRVTLDIGVAAAGWSEEHSALAQADGVVAFSVSDTGVGIPPDKLQLIFEAFQQADGGTARKYGGTGLGLSISRELARLLDGEIRVESELGTGSIFTLYLPCRKSDGCGVSDTENDDAAESALVVEGEDESGAPPAPWRQRGLPLIAHDAAPEGALPYKQHRRQDGTATAFYPYGAYDGMVGPVQAPPAAELGLAGRKVLIVDDDLRNIFALSAVLEREHMKVRYAENGREGIEALQSDPGVDIVLMDIMMPGLDGYDTMRAIRRNPVFRSLPIITLTAKAMKGDREKCIAAGASDYIAKPVDAEELVALMRDWVRA